jgi:hypothetical protein
MKILIMFLTLLLVSLNSFGQKKSKVDPKDKQIDSLTMVTKNLTLQVDSLTGELIKYKIVYITIKEKVLHYNFDPTRSVFLMDSLQASRDSAYAFLFKSSKSTALADQMSILMSENTKLKTEIDSMGKKLEAINDEELVRAAAIGNLKQLKELLDSKIITDLEFVTMKKKYMEKL